MTKKTRTLRALLTNVSSQRTPYKPYGYSLDFSRSIDPVLAKTVFVEVEIPEEFVLQEEDEALVVSLNGLAAILQATADSVDELDRTYLKKLQKGE